MKMFTDIAIQDLRDPYRVTPKRGVVADCEHDINFLHQLKFRQNRWEQRNYILQKNLWQAAIDDKIVEIWQWARDFSKNDKEAGGPLARLAPAEKLLGKTST